MPLSWDLHRSFLALSREGSLSRAARRLGLTQPTLGRHLEQLEQGLGLPLFVRSPRGLAPTPAALALLAAAESMEAAAEAFARSAVADAAEVSGVVRITASEIIGVEVLPPMLAELSERHPGLAIELSISDTNQDLLRRDADVAVRMARPSQAALVAKLVGVIPVGWFAHRSYLDRRGTPSSALELAEHTVIGFDRETPPDIGEAFGVELRRELFRYRCDSQVGQLAALRAGVGVGVCQTPLASRDVDLRRVLPEVGFELPAWVVMHEDQRGSPRVQAVFDHLADGLQAYVRSGR